MSLEAESVVEYGHRMHPVVHWLAPVVTIAGVWVAKEGITRIYVRVTGREAPVPSDPRTSWKRALAWTAVTTTAAALIEVSVRRLANEREVLRIVRRGGQSDLSAQSGLGPEAGS
jgi:hypothetical protein